jgi:hypothetical protein
MPGISCISHCFVENCQLESLKNPKLKDGPINVAAITQPPSTAITKPKGITFGVHAFDRGRDRLNIISRYARFLEIETKRASVVLMPRGYMEGPAAEEAERRLEELERGPAPEDVAQRLAVYGSTDDEAEPHFLGWRDEVDPDELFESGRAWGLKVVRRNAA